MRKLKSALPFLSLLLVTSLICSLVKAQGQPNWVNYSKDFLLNDIDFDGNLIWISTYGGLVRFDKNSGTSHVLTGANSGITNSNINNTFVASNGDKWISTSNGGLVRYDNTTWTNYHILASGDTIHQLFDLDEDPSGNIWFSSYPNGMMGGLQGGTELYKFDGTDFNKIPLPFPSYVFDLACDSIGNVWAVCYNSLCKFDGIGWTTYDTTNSNMPGVPTTIEIDYSGNLWVTGYGSNGMWLSSLVGGVFTNNFISSIPGNSLILSINQNNTILAYNPYGIGIFDGTNFTALNNLPYNSIGVAQIDDAGKIYVGFYTDQENVFYEYDTLSNTWSDYFISNSYLRSAYGRDIAFDDNNNKWMVSNSDYGIVKFDGSNWTTYTTLNSGLPNDRVTRVFFDSNGNMWTGHNSVGGSTAPLARFDNSTWQTFPLTNLFPSGNGNVLDITEDLMGNIWVATSQGIARYSSGVWSYFTSPVLPSPGNLIDEIKVDQNNNVYAIAYQFGLLKYDGSNWTFINSTNSGMANDNVFSLDFDMNNNLWITLSNSLVQKFDGNSWTTYPQAINGISSPGANNISCNQIDNSVWISTNAECVKFDGSNWIRFDVFNSGICSGLVKTCFDKYNNKWMVTSTAGFVVYNENGINYETVFNLPDKKITGNVFYDANGNGLFDVPADHGVSGRRVRLLPDSAVTFTNSSGKFSFKRNAGTYEVEYLPDSNWVITSDSLKYHVQLDSILIDSLDFGTNFSGFENTGVITCVGINDRCNINSPHSITYRNEGTTVLNGEVKYVIDSTFTFDYAIPQPDAINGDTLEWNYVDLLQFEERQILVLVQNPGPQPIGQLSVSHATLYQNQQPLSSDTSFQQIRCSYDPNDKMVQPIGVGVNHEVLNGTTLTYTLRFQNTGNDTAFFVILIDTLSSYLDVSTFEFLGSSHPVSFDCSSAGIIRFTFDDINLLWRSLNEPASCGYVKFKINHKTNLALPVVINNSAHIYFDFNPGIITNEVSNTIVNSFTGIENESAQAGLWKIYPNPSTGFLNMEFADELIGSEVAIYDSNGRLCDIIKLESGSIKLQIDNFNNGLFLLKCVTPDNNILIQKLVLLKQ